MTKAELAKQAFEEACSPKTTAHHGGGAGRPYWNTQSFQYMYTPSFQFQNIPGCKQYRYTAVDEKGEMHCFLTDDASALLTPIWREIPEGVVELTVHALNEDGSDRYLVGARTFFKTAPFPANFPPAARSYRESATLAYDFAYRQSFVQHWLTDGTPDPNYDYYVFPNKMISSLINAMIIYSGLRPECAADAITIAKRAADYMIATSEPAGRPLAHLPLTYMIDFRPDPDKHENFCAPERLGTMMMIYPASAGISYLKLEKVTGDTRYFDAALKIGEFYRDHVLPNGSWHIILDRETGEPTSTSYCNTLSQIVPFLMSLYERTDGAVWKTLADNARAYIEREQLATYNWEGQFEDSYLSIHYSNLTPFEAEALIAQYTKYHADDAEKMAACDDLMRFIEDQFVVWTRACPWNRHPTDPSIWSLPAALEQYQWHMPIDSSTAACMNTFINMYRAGRGELHLAKARALADQLTRMQNPTTGQFPTHWMLPDCRETGGQFWMNCHFSTAARLAEFADFLDEANIK